MRQFFSDFWMIVFLGEVRESSKSRFDVAVLQCWMLLDWSNVSGMGWESGWDH